MEKKDLEREKEYLEKVKQVIQKIIDDSKAAVEEHMSNINESKKFLWDNLADYTDEERMIALNDVDSSVDRTNSSIEDIIKYERIIKNPYFAKLLFEIEEDDEIPIYIGTKSVQGKNSFLVFDWRAPISSMFYNYELGKAQYEAPMGTIEGEITKKTQFKIEDGKIIRCFESDINIDDDYLQEVLSSSSNDKMKNIVSTIQREQNEIIRNIKDKHLIVQGIAGSGKTSVALHRIAFLLYQYKNLSYNNILIFSPNDVFSGYISNVLPELGERNVLTSTFNDFANTYFKSHKKVESFSEFLERIYSSDISLETSENIKYKLGNDIQNDLDTFIKKKEYSLNFGNGLVVNNKTIPADYIRELFVEKYAKFTYQERFELIAENICTLVRLKNKANLKKVTSSVKSLLDKQYDIYEFYNEFLASRGIESNISPKKTINYEDVTALLYIYFKINGYPNYGEIRQVVIDEAQDYSKFQMNILRDVFSKASFTILGDVCQTINPYYKYESLSELEEILPKGRYLELNKTYRSSSEIIDYSNQILGLDNVCAIRKSKNVPVDIKNVDDKEVGSTIQADLSDMNEQGLFKIAIITRNVSDAKTIYESIKNKYDMDVQLITSNSDNIASKVIIIPSYLAKGLEFDAVIACNNPDNNYSESEKNIYYVVCTRAQHKLNIYNEPTQVLKLNRKNK